MLLGIKGDVDGGVSGEESLGRTLGLELLLLALALANRQVRILRSIVADHAPWVVSVR